MPYKLTLDTPEAVLLPGAVCEVRLKATATRLVRSGQTEKVLAAKGTIKFLDHDKVLHEAPTDEDGIVTHKFELRLTNQPSSLRVDAAFRSPSGEVATSPYQRVTIPPAPRDRKDRDPDEKSTRYNLVITGEREDRPGNMHAYVLKARVTKTERRGDQGTRDVPVRNQQITFIYNRTPLNPPGNNAPAELTDAAGEAVFQTPLVEAEDFEKTVFLSARAELGGQMVVSNTLAGKIPAKKRTEVSSWKTTHHLLVLTVKSRQPSESTHEFLLRARLTKIEEKNGNTRELPVSGQRVHFSVNGKYLSENALPPTDRDGEAFLTDRHDIGDTEEFLYYLAQVGFSPEHFVSSQTVIEKLPAKEKPKETPVADLEVYCQGNSARVTVKDAAGKPIAAQLTITPHKPRVQICTADRKDLVSQPVSIPAGSTVFFFYHTKKDAFNATFAAGGVSRTSIIYPERKRS